MGLPLLRKSEFPDPAAPRPSSRFYEADGFVTRFMITYGPTSSTTR
jgi:hypothetical protein